MQINNIIIPVTVIFMNTIPVLLIDQAEVTTAGLVHTLRELNYDLHFNEVGTLVEVFPFIKENPNCIVFMNIHSKRMNGYFMASSLLKENKKLKIILISSSFANPLLPRLIRLGAKAVLTIDSTRKEFQDAFRSVVAGDQYLFGTESVPAELQLSFSPLEFQLIHMLSEGKTSKEISHELHHTSKTIETYRSRLLRKTGMKNTSELLSYFFRNELS
jgi:DNA-binding NarL/FixJ family response regulator